MIEQDFILLIFNCEKYRFKAVKQKQTWLVNLPTTIIYFHIIGKPELTNDFEYDTTNNILYVKVEDDYNRLPKKVISAYNAILKTYKFKYIFKTDDDQNIENIIFLNILIKKLNNAFYDEKNKIHYGGYVIDVKNSYKSEYYRIHPELPCDLIVYKTIYCSGRFYFLSNDAVRYLIKKSDLIAKEYLEDYAIGFYLNNDFKHNILHLDTNKYFTDIKFL
jgi:hypothetical protein